MEKPNLVIDEELGKVFLGGEEVAEITNHSIFHEDDFEMTISKEQMTNFPFLKLSDFYDINISSIFILIEDDFISNLKWVSSPYIRIYNNLSEFVCFFLEFDEWNFKFSVHLFLEKMNENFMKIKSVLYLEEEFDSIIDKGVYFNFSIEDEFQKIILEYYKLLESFVNVINMTLYELQENDSNQPNLSNTFTFPPEIQSSCEQYLIYFATFLKDIGIHAETNIESRAHETLFTVISKDGEEALDKIKEALHVYLSLPENSDFEIVASEFTDVGVQQLVSQVHFLKSQLALGKTMIQMKDATIEALQLTNYQQKEIIQSHKAEEKNEEKIANGLVTVKEVGVKGVSLNLPELLRRIKRKFKM